MTYKETALEYNSATMTPPTRRDWLGVGERFSEPHRAAVEEAIDELRWTGKLTGVAMSPALAIRACIEQLRMPKVSAIAPGGSVEVPIGSQLGRATYSIYGIEANYAKGQRIRAYVLDTGTEITPLAVDVWDA